MDRPLLEGRRKTLLRSISRSNTSWLRCAAISVTESLSSPPTHGCQTTNPEECGSALSDVHVGRSSRLIPQREFRSPWRW